jgi:hypothetical protein
VLLDAGSIPAASTILSFWAIAQIINKNQVFLYKSIPYDGIDFSIVFRKVVWSGLFWSGLCDRIATNREFKTWFF